MPAAVPRQVPLRLPVREDARVVRARRRGALPRHAEPHQDRARVPEVDNHTTYSFGLDDQEFVVAFDTDDVGAFLDLVQELRGTEASAYTLRDTPSFTCLRVSLERALSALDGEPVPALAGLT